jgi:hypothetical protein
MICHDLQRPCARAFVYVRVCLLAMVFAIVFAVALAAPSAVAQTTTPQYLFLTTGVPERPRYLALTQYAVHHHPLVLGERLCEIA